VEVTVYLDRERWIKIGYLDREIWIKIGGRGGKER